MPTLPEEDYLVGMLGRPIIAILDSLPIPCKDDYHVVMLGMSIDAVVDSLPTISKEDYHAVVISTPIDAVLDSLTAFQPQQKELPRKMPSSTICFTSLRRITI